MKARRTALALFLSIGALAAGAGDAVADEWHSEQPVVAGIGVPVPLGAVGEIEFWAPNRGILITAGNDGVPAGLFANDGTGWYRYSTVCGGHDGRIAWAGPDDFWTISDQRPGQETGSSPPQHISLCHFKGGQVVASYAEPVGSPSSYLPMSAAACSGPDDCWFAGDRLPGTVNAGAFHLHWDGRVLAAVPSLTEPQPEIADPGRSVRSLAFHQGNLYESVEVRGEDFAPGESTSQPYFLHQIIPGAANPFVPLFPEKPLVYGVAGALPSQLEAFRLSSNGDHLWAIAGALSAPAMVTVLRLGADGLLQIPLEDSGHVLSPGDQVSGTALEPGSEDAWVAFRHSEDGSQLSPARLTRIHSDGRVDAPTLLPREAEGIGRKGPAGPIACPAADQCWMATEGGWLFHLGPDLPQDTDPVLHQLITFRPTDHSLPVVPPISLPEDNSGAYLPSDEPPLPLRDGERRGHRPHSLLGGVRQRVIGKTTLELTFVLHAAAHVRLVAKRDGRVVAATKRYKMAKGRRSLRLRLDPERWPTSLDLQAHRVAG